ncbi:MAG: ABC transporter ATP-binding protein [Sulfolobaceae archaeon]|nr:ABC transporter ATP-binding protein [Candidatus Jingweiarchaeum tengchongense]
MNVENIIKIEHLRAIYKISKTSGINALDDINIEMKKGQIIGIAGESGSGKTSLLKVLTHSFPPSMEIKGNVSINLQDKSINLLKLSDSQIQSLCWKVWSYVPQAAMNSLNPMAKIKDIFWETLESHDKTINSYELEKQIENAFEKVGLSKKFLNFYSNRLSGGMRQRVIILLATISRPNIIYLDEPTTGLDLVTQRDVIQLLQSIHNELNNTFILVTHDISIHAQIADLVHVMYKGQIIESALTNEIFHNPLHPYTKNLINSVPIIGEHRGKIEPGIKILSTEMSAQGCKFKDRCQFAMPQCDKYVYTYRLNDHEVKCNLYESH